jgi:hypothetical protein
MVFVMPEFSGIPAEPGLLPALFNFLGLTTSTTSVWRAAQNPVQETFIQS